MKSYKDIDKSIVMNAPEGAMWWNTNNNMYYKYYKKAFWFFCAGKWEDSVGFEHLAEMQGDLRRIPLPNIEIPWEATEDSVCPVPDGNYLEATLVSGRYTYPSSWYWHKERSYVTSYKIIDEEYLPKEDEHLKEEEDDPAIEALVEHLSKEEQKAQVIKNLEFLQILASKFPEIKDKVVELMEVELDAWWHSTFEEQGGE